MEGSPVGSAVGMYDGAPVGWGDCKFVTMMLAMSVFGGAFGHVSFQTGGKSDASMMSP